MMHGQKNIEFKLCFMAADCSWVFCIDLMTKSEYFPIQL